MLLILLSTLLFIPSLLGLGKFFETLFKTEISEGISAKIILGIFGISLTWLILAFFIPLNLYVEIPSLLFGLFYFFKENLFRDFYKFSRNEWILLSIGSITILFCGSFYPYILDHFGYYVPTVEWLKEYGLVKGISNLDLILGQMSVWHIFQAGFSNFADPFLRINTILLIVYLLYIVEKKSWIQLCFLPLFLLFSQSPSPDLPVFIFSLIILNEIISGNKKVSLIFAFSVFVFSIKPTLIWLPIFTFLYSIFLLKSSVKAYIPGVLIFILFCFKNIWTFGHPVFPIPILDLGFSWKPNAELLKSSSQYAILKTFDNQYSYEEILQFSWFDYVKNWLFLAGIKSIINILFIISLLVFIIFTFIKKNKTITFLCISLLIKSVLVLLFSAQYRFFMDVFFVLFFVLFLHQFRKRKAILVFSFSTVFFVGFLCFPNLIQNYLPNFRPSNSMGKFEWKQLYKPSTYEYKKFHSFQVGNLKFKVSEKYPFNFDTPLPAISESYIFDYQKAGIFPQLIDKNDLQKGFISKKTNLKEQKEVEKITHTLKNSHKH